MENKGKTWSRGTNSRLPLGVNVNLNSFFVLCPLDSIIHLSNNKGQKVIGFYS